MPHLDRSIGERILSVALILVGAALLGPPAAGGMTPPQVRAGDAQGALLQWPLPPGAEQYADLDGRRMHQYVVEAGRDLAPLSGRGAPEVLGPNHRYLGRRVRTGGSATEALPILRCTWRVMGTVRGSSCMC